MADYDVVLLVEQMLTPQDAQQVRSLHDGLDDPVAYHLLLPLDDAAARVEASLGSLSGGELLASPGLPMADVDLEAVRADSRDRSRSELTASVAALEAAGATVASSTVVTGSPVEELAAKAREERMKGLKGKEWLMEYGRENRYKIVLASWVASMGASLGLVWRDKYLSKAQKLVQARVYAQGLTLLVLIASAAFEVSDARNPGEKPKHVQHYPGEDAWKGELLPS